MKEYTGHCVTLQRGEGRLHLAYIPLDIYGTLEGLGPNFWPELVQTFGPLVDPFEAQFGPNS